MANVIDRKELEERIAELQLALATMPIVKKGGPPYFCWTCQMITNEKKCWCDFESPNIDY